MLNKLPVMNPIDTIPFLQERFSFPPYITLAHMFNPPDNWFMTPQYVPQYQLLYGVEGGAEQHINNKSYTLGKGDMVLIPPDALRSLHPSREQGYCGITVTFHFGDAEDPLSLLLKEGYYVGTGTRLEWLQSFLTLIQGLQDQTKAGAMLAQGQLLTILSRLMKRDGVQEQGVHSKVSMKMVHVCNYMKENYHKKIRLETLCEMTGLSRNYIIRQFRQCYGKTPLDFLTEIRFDKAKQLAMMTSLSIGEIANEVGYEDVHSFSRMFKKKLGISLSQFIGMMNSSLDMASPYKNE